MKIVSEIEHIDKLGEFFQGWRHKPEKSLVQKVIDNSEFSVFVLDDLGRALGFATVISDRALFAMVTLIEVLPSHQGQGIGTLLLEAIKSEFADIYGLDLVCDENVAGFYESNGFRRTVGMIIRRPGVLSAHQEK